MVGGPRIGWGEVDRINSERLDPVTAWIADRGRAFSEFLTADTGNDKDFRFVAAIDVADPTMELGTERVVPVHPDSVINTFAGVEADEAFVAQKLQMQDPRVFLVPLRQAAVRPAEIGGEPITPPRTTPGKDAGRGAEPAAVVAIVDHAINFAHERFRTEAGTRVEFAWVQDADFDETEDLAFGREYLREEIDASVAASGGDEESLLRRLDLVDFARPDIQPLGMRTSHGTHVLDLLAGFKPHDPVAARVPIIAVTLPPIVARETAGALLGVFFLQALEYILDRAQRLGPGIPVFVNFSFGLSGGPRRGRHFLERAMAALVRRYRKEAGAPVTIALPAGNRALDRGHAADRFDPAERSFEIDWHLQPGDPTSNYLDIWVAVPDGGQLGGSLTLSLTPPGGEPIVESFTAHDGGLESYSAARFILRDWPGDESVRKEIGRAALRREAPGLLHLNVALAPTDPGATRRPPAPPGAWRLSVGGISVDGGGAVNVEAWILRDDVVPGFPDSGRQSRFVDDAYQPWSSTGFAMVEDPPDGKSLIRRAGTLNALATGVVLDEKTGARPLVAGGALGYCARAEEGARMPAPYTGQPLPSDTRMAGGEAVTEFEVSDRSPAVPGVLAAASRSGARIAINGTSVAAPQMLRRKVLAAIGPQRLNFEDD